MQPQRRDFATTRWTIVLRAAEPGTPASKEAFEILYTTYWRPLYSFLRRQGHSKEEAEDLLQAFWAFLLEKAPLRHADPNRGRFRSFLYTALQNFAINERERNQAKKRGGGVPVLPLEIATAEGLFQIEPMTNETPEKIFDRQWAETVLEQVLIKLRDGMTPEKARQFDVLKVHLVGDRTEGGYARTAASLGMSEVAARTEVSRLKARLKKLLKNEIAHTVSSPEEIEDEIRHLFDSVRR